MISNLEALKLLAIGYTINSNNLFYRIKENVFEQSDVNENKGFKKSNITINEFLLLNNCTHQVYPNNIYEV